MDNRLEQIPISKKLDETVAYCMEQLQEEKTFTRARHFRKACISIGTAAAVFICVVFFTVSNPDAAESIPMLKDLARMMHSGEPDILECVQKSKGVTITLSDISHDYNTINMNIKVENENGFPDSILSLSNPDDAGKLEFYSRINVDFCSPQIDTSHFSEGSFTDEHTFEGTICIPLATLELEADSDIPPIPEMFQLHWDISSIHYWNFDLWKFQTEHPSSDGYCYLTHSVQDGAWNFEIPVTFK